MLREWANKDTLDKIEELLDPPPSWRDPVTQLPAGFDDEAAEWEAWTTAMRG